MWMPSLSTSMASTMPRLLGLWSDTRPWCWASPIHPSDVRSRLGQRASMVVRKRTSEGASLAIGALRRGLRQVPAVGRVVVGQDLVVVRCDVAHVHERFVVFGRVGQVVRFHVTGLGVVADVVPVVGWFGHGGPP